MAYFGKIQAGDTILDAEIDMETVNEPPKTTIQATGSLTSEGLTEALDALLFDHEPDDLSPPIGPWFAGWPVVVDGSREIVEVKEIKFRAWHKRERRWYEPTHIGVNGYRAVMSIYTGSTWLTEGHYPDDFELMQFTGLTDKSGKDIYEGDNVAYLDNTSQGLIKKIVTIMDIRHLPDFTCSKWQEIIGNIYDNPELLKEEQP